MNVTAEMLRDYIEGNNGDRIVIFGNGKHEVISQNQGYPEHWKSVVGEVRINQNHLPPKKMEEYGDDEIAGMEADLQAELNEI